MNIPGVSPNDRKAAAATLVNHKILPTDSVICSNEFAASLYSNLKVGFQILLYISVNGY